MALHMVLQVYRLCLTTIRCAHNMLLDFIYCAAVSLVTLKVLGHYPIVHFATIGVTIANLGLSPLAKCYEIFHICSECTTTHRVARPPNHQREAHEASQLGTSCLG